MKTCRCSKIFFFFLSLFIFSTTLFAVGEVSIKDILSREIAPLRYELSFQITNTTSDVREVTLRSQIELFDRSAPVGDLPVNILRKDQTMVLRAGESRDVMVHFVGEGPTPKGDLRVSPLVRIRRQRVWNY